MTIQDLKLLRGIIDDSISKLESYYTAKSVDFPSLDGPFNSNPAAEALSSEPSVVEAVNAITAASYQLMMTARPPFLSIFDAATAYELSACLRVAEQINAVEYLREAGPAGRDINDLAKTTGMEPTRLARIFRLLATHHIFREVKPNVFANNRISSYFDSGKSSAAIASGKIDKHEGTTGAAAVIDHVTDEVCKASSYLYETLTDPVKKYSFSAIHAPMQQAFNMDRQFFSWIEEPGNEKRFSRYNACIRGTSLWNSPNAILHGFDWASLTPDDLVVDVGGGNGMPSMIVAQAFPQVRIVIQERPQVVEHGLKFWNEVYPEAIKSGRVRFEAHEFFDAQPQTNASVFFVRTILHDWPDHDCETILNRLRAAAAPKTKLVIGDFIIPFACPDDSDVNLLPGAKAIQAPKPLLANLGKASSTAYCLDMTMLTNFNGQERTLPHHVELAKKCGWKAIQVHRRDDSPFGFIVCAPA
ncbi:hypothetical protein JAAARDRAFT_125414 [Jaapia argillacea MUCL 33604]|uniref:Uncharacterized protein n=1 Tax=Jaapia argillacea MUCL 33604 TaxID=933084 RepID=A0A067Q1C2_9AGAM|nr:hypothetical protein JAAARDRAFT_125414 [Jaapia argillacea MUCL 33604]